MDSPEDRERYLRSCRKDFWERVFRIELGYLKKYLAGSRDVLSVGCGPANIEIELGKGGFSVIGLDISREALGRVPDKVRAVAARAEDMPFAEAAFDAVIYVASLQFIEDYRKAIDKTVRVLRPKGKIIVMLLNPESDFYKESLRDLNSYMRKIRHTNLDEIESALAKRFQVRTEYFMGVKDGRIFESRDAAEAVLYIIRGTKEAINRV